MIVLLIIAFQSYSHLAVQEHNIRYDNPLIHSQITYESDAPSNRILLKANGTIIAALPCHRELSWIERDTLGTIWLPDTSGGITYPAEFVGNPNNHSVYIIGLETRNIAVCDAQTGQRTDAILTGDGTIDLAYNSTDDKLYCANYYEGTIDVIDCETNDVITSIPLQSSIIDQDWNSINDCLYYGAYDFGRVDVIDCTVDTVIAHISVGPYPRAVQFNPLSNKVYCAFQDTINGYLAIIDCSTNSVLTTIVINNGNFRFAFNSVSNKIYCVNTSTNEVSIVDGAGDTLITTLAISDWPECVAYNPIMNRIYIGHIGGQCITVIDGSTDQLITTIPLGEWAWALAYDSLDNRLFVASVNDRAIVINCATNTVIGYLDAANWPMGIFWDSEFNQVWIGNTGASNFPGFTIDGYSGDGLDVRFKTAVGYTPYSPNLDTATNKYHAAGRGDRIMAILDMNDPVSAVMKTVREGPWDVVDNQVAHKIYCANGYSNRVSVLDAFTDSTLAEVPTRDFPVALAFNQTDNKAYTVNYWGTNVTIIDGNTNNSLGNILVGGDPYDILWNPTDNKIYTANFGNNTVTIIDAHADTAITTLAAGEWPWSLAHNTVDDKVYVSNYASDDITVIDGETDKLLTTIYLPTDAYPLTLVYNPVDNKLYSANIISKTLTIIDAHNDAIITTLSLPGFPFALAYNSLHNTIFCAYINSYTNEEAIIVISGAKDEITANIGFPIRISAYGMDSPKNALLYDPIHDVVYFSHCFSSKITVIDGTTGIDEVASGELKSHTLQIAPNPAKGLVNIEYQILHRDNASLSIYDAAGKIIKQFAPSLERIVWDLTDSNGKKASAGVYFVKLQDGDSQITEKVVLLK